MCGRFLMLNDEDNKEIQSIVEEVNKKFNTSVKTGEIFPTNIVPVLLKSKGEIVPEPLIWGFPNFNKNGVIINARSETSHEKKMFKESLVQHRCIILSSGFYEWMKLDQKKKQKYLFTIENEKLLYMAGLYNIYENEKRFVILTTSANESISDVHDRMPVILSQNNITNWINDTESALNILNQSQPELVRKAV